MDASHTSESSVRRTTSVWRTWLFNPFHYLAGGKALAWGLACIVLTAWLGGAFDYRYTGMLSSPISHPTSIWLSITQGLTVWAVPSVLLFIGGRQLSRSQVRVIDVFGTQALARVPGLLMALIVVWPFGDLLESFISPGTSHFAVAQYTALIAVGTVMMLLLVWIVLLMYRAFSVSCNVTGGWAIAVFITSITLGEVTAGVTGHFLQDTVTTRSVASVSVQSDQHPLAAQLATRILPGARTGPL